MKCNYEGDQKISYNWGSLMHGVLMELLPEDTADFLHESRLHPYSQYVIPISGNKLEWNIGIWDDDVAEAIIKSIMPLTKINIKHKETFLNVLSINRSIISEQGFLSQSFTNEQLCRRYKMEFLTPCTHKSGGEYILFPSQKLILQSLYMRFSSFASDFSVDDEEILSQLVEHTKIAYYSLHSSRFHLKGMEVNGYIGRIILTLRGPEQLVRLTGMLLSFAEYAGVGIKTSLGMGGCSVKQEYPNTLQKEGMNK